MRSWIPPLVIAAVGVALFGSTWTDAVQAADSGELIAAACNLGVAHPPGYPLYTLVGHVACQLPWWTPAGRIAGLSVFAGVWTLLFVYWVVLRISASRWAAAVAALTLATGSIFWRFASVAGHDTLHAALAVTLVYASLRVAEDRGRGAQLRWSAVAGLLCGLILCNHHSGVLVFPLAAVVILRPTPGWRRGILRSLAAAGGVVVGLLPLLHLLLSDPAVTPRWGETDSWDGLLHHLLRRDYGTFSLTLDGQADPLRNLWLFLRSVPSQTGWLLWPLGVIGGLALFFRGADRPLGRLLDAPARRDVGVALALLPVITGPAFMLMFNVAPGPIGEQMASRFFVLPLVFVAVSVGVGLAVVDRTWLSGEGRGARRRLWHVGTWIVVAMTALLSFKRADMSESYAIEDYAHNCLGSVQRGALIIGLGDVRLFSILYAQQVEKIRPDVQYVDLKLLLYPWYAAQKKRERPGFSYRFRAGNVDSLGLIHGELQRGVPVYLTVVHNRKVMTAFGGYPVGPMFRLLPVGKPTPPPSDVFELNERLFRGFSRRGRQVDREADPWSASLMDSYALTWRSVARVLNQTGDRRRALKALIYGQRWAPWSKVPRWFGPRQNLKPRQNRQGR